MLKRIHEFLILKEKYLRVFYFMKIFENDLREIFEKFRVKMNL